MEQPFYIGQKVVCLKSYTTPSGLVCCTKGKEYTIVGLHFYCIWRVDVGVNPRRSMKCPSCDFGSSTVCWFSPGFFAPVQEGFEAITFERVMEEEKVSVN